MSLRIFVSVGTDHHPFPRLITWVDQWVADRSDVSLVVQHGFSPASVHGANVAMMSAQELAAQYGSCDLAVTQVGPGTIADANAAGIKPLVVPRTASLHEAVDDHQFDFGSFMAEQGRCSLATSYDTFAQTLDSIAADPGRAAFTDESASGRAADAVALLAAQIVASPHQPLSRHRIAAMLRSPRSRARR